jgi:hypothetical protein
VIVEKVSHDEDDHGHGHRREARRITTFGALCGR